MAASAPAAGQSVSGITATLASDDLFRGRSVSAGRPVARIGGSIDDPSGAYAGANATWVLGGLGHDGLLSFAASAGVARRLDADLTLDVGLVGTRYTKRWSGGRKAGYAEAYLGLIGQRLSGRLLLSPNYFRPGVITAYASGELVLLSHDPWRIGISAGALAWISSGRPDGASAFHLDERVSLSRRFGRARLEAAWTNGGPNRDYYRNASRGHAQAVLSLIANF